MITYRKTKQGEWVAYGLSSAIKPGADVTVTKRSGETKTEHIAAVGKAFAVDGKQMAYGYLAETGKSTSRPASKRTSDHFLAGERPNGQRCLDCGGWLSAFDLNAAAVPGFHFDCA